MAYLINIQNTGLSSDDQAEAMVEILQAQGFAVEFTSNYGLINNGECPVPLDVWEAALIEADAS